MASIANIAFYRGEDVLLTVTMSPVTAILGWNLQFSLREHYGDPGSPLIVKTNGAGITLIDTTNGIFTVPLAQADTLPLAFGAYVYDIQRTDSGSRTVLVAGNVNLLPEVAE